MAGDAVRGAGTIVAGFGFRQSVEATSLHAVFRAARGAHDIAALACLTDKAVHPAFQSFAAQARIPVQEVSAKQSRAMTTQTQSAASQAARGTGSVAEACAMAAAGPGARLLLPRIVSEDGTATCALAILAETDKP